MGTLAAAGAPANCAAACCAVAGGHVTTVLDRLPADDPAGGDWYPMALSGRARLIWSHPAAAALC